MRFGCCTGIVRVCFFFVVIANEGIEYRPLVFSCWGHSHSDVNVRWHKRRCADMAKSARDLSEQTRSAIGVQLWHRAAQMVEACFPQLDLCDASLDLPVAVSEALQRQWRWYDHFSIIPTAIWPAALHPEAASAPTASHARRHLLHVFVCAYVAVFA